MLYFLVFIIPFIAVMIYLTKRNRKVKEKYELLINRITLILSKQDEELVSELKELNKGTLLTYDDIKNLEVILQKLESKIDLDPSKFISNTFNSRWKQLEFIEEKIRKVEKHIKSKEVTT